MKKSYKLLGVIYDHIPEVIEYNVIKYDSSIYDYKDSRNLFDNNIYVRKVDLSVFFSMENNEVLGELLEIISEMDYIVLNIDFKIGLIKVLDEFIDKRIRQIVYMLNEKSINCKIMSKWYEQNL